MIKPSQPGFRPWENHTTALRARKCIPPFGAVRHQRGGCHRRWLIMVMLIMSYDTESKSRNVPASPLGEEGHEVAKGVQANWIHRGAPRPANPVRRHPAKSVWTVVRMIMILDVDVTAERRHYNTHRPIGRYHNPRPEGPSNLRTFRPSGRSILRTLTPKVCPKASAATTTPSTRSIPIYPVSRFRYNRIIKQTLIYL